MGSSRSSQGLARRRTRQPSSVLKPGPAQSGWVPHRQDLRCLGRDRVIDPGADPAGAAHPGVDPPPENLVVCGPSGTGKTHFCEALGHVAVDAGHKVSWFSLEHLGALVRRHSADDTAAKAIRRIMRADVIVIDDIGLLPVTADTAEALYRVVDAAYEKRSIALSSNLHPAGFDELMPKTIANATVDRLLLHAHIVMTAGDSIRLTQAIAGKGGDATDQLNPGQICWPRTGSSAGRHWAILPSATGQIPLAIDTARRKCPQARPRKRLMRMSPLRRRSGCRWTHRSRAAVPLREVLALDALHASVPSVGRPDAKA